MATAMNDGKHVEVRDGSVDCRLIGWIRYPLHVARGMISPPGRTLRSPLMDRHVAFGCVGTWRSVYSKEDTSKIELKLMVMSDCHGNRWPAFKAGDYTARDLREKLGDRFTEAQKETVDG